MSEADRHTPNMSSLGDSPADADGTADVVAASEKGDAAAGQAASQAEGHTEGHTGGQAAAAQLSAAAAPAAAQVASSGRISAMVAEPPVPDASPEALTPPGRSRGFGALVAGGCLAAVIGAGATVAVLPHLPPQVLAGLVPAQPAQNADLSDTVAALGQKLSDLEAQVGALKQAAAAPSEAGAAMAGAQAALDATAASVRSLTERVDGMDQRLSQISTAGGADSAAQGSESADALQQQIDALKQSLAQLSPESLRSELASAVDAARTALAQDDAKAENLRDEAEAEVRQTIAQSAVARLSTAFVAGLPMGPALADAQQLGVALPEGLSANVPTLVSLQTAFPQAARDALAQARKSEARSGGFGERLGAFLLAQTGARSVAPRDGAGADAVLSRAQAAVDAGDIALALQEISTLPQASQQAASGWVTLAQERVAAGAALAKLSAPQAPAQGAGHTATPAAAN